MLCPTAHAAPAELVSTETSHAGALPEESLLLGSAMAYVRNGLEYSLHPSAGHSEIVVKGLY